MSLKTIAYSEYASTTEPKFLSIAEAKDLYAPATIHQAPSKLGGLMDKIWQHASNATLGDADWASIGHHYDGIVPYALLVRDVRKNGITAFADSHPVIGLASEVRELNSLVYPTYDTPPLPLRGVASGEAVAVMPTPNLLMGLDAGWAKLSSLMALRPTLSSFCDCVQAKTPSATELVSFMLRVRMVVARAIGRLASFETVEASPGYMKIKLTARTTIDLLDWVDASNKVNALRVYALLLPVMISNLDVIINLDGSGSLWTHFAGAVVLNYRTYSTHPLYQARKVLAANGTVEFTFDDPGSPDSDSVSYGDATVYFAVGGEGDDGSSRKKGKVTDDPEEGDPIIDEDPYTDDDRKSPMYGITSSSEDIVSSSPTDADSVNDTLVEGDVIGTLAAVSYADDTKIERQDTFGDVDVTSLTAPQLADISMCYAALFTNRAYPQKWTEDLESALVGSDLGGYATKLLSKGWTGSMFVSPLVPNVTAIAAGINNGIKKAATKCDPAQLRGVAMLSGDIAQLYRSIDEDVAAGIPEEGENVFITPLGSYVIRELPEGVDAYAQAGPESSVLEADQLCFIYSCVTNHAPYAEDVGDMTSLAAFTTDVVKRHTGVVAIPKAWTIPSCEHTELGGLIVGGKRISCLPELTLARAALKELRALKDVSADVHAGGAPGYMHVSPAPRNLKLVPILTGGVAALSTAIADAVAFKKEQEDTKAR